MAGELAKAGLDVAAGEFFHEFVTTSAVPASKILDALKEKGILGGLPLDGDEGSRILWCCTEMNTKKDIDEVVAVIKEVLAC